MSLRLKTILAIGLVEILVLMVLGYSTLSAMQRSILQEFDSRIKVTQQLVSGVAKEALIAFDLARLDGVVQELIKDPDIDYVGVSTNNNWISLERNTWMMSKQRVPIMFSRNSSRLWNTFLGLESSTSQ